MRQRISTRNQIQNDPTVYVNQNDKKASLHVDSDDKTNGTYGDANYQNSNKIINKQIKKIGIREIDIFYSIPNINESNNKFTFQTQNGGVNTYTFELDVDNYNNIVDLTDELLLKMNAQTNIFSMDVNDNHYVLTGTLPFKFLHSLGLQNSNCTGIFTTEFSLSLLFNPTLQYTRYIDFVCSSLKKSIITRDSFTTTKNFSEKDHFSRVYVDTDRSGITTQIPRKIVKKYKHINYFPVDERDIDNIEIKLYTEKGEPIYIQTTEDGVGNLYEVKLLKYGLDFSLIS